MTSKKDKKITRRFANLCLCLTLLGSNASAQSHAPNLPANNNLVLAEELHQQQKYRGAISAAGKYLQQYHQTTNKKHQADIDKAGYIQSTAMLKCGDHNADIFAKEYINNTANPAYKQRAAYALAQDYFNNSRYQEAIPYYEIAGFANLNNGEVIQARFELAYCYFSNGQFNQAEPLLASVRELGGKYYDAGNYYYGLLAYNKSNYLDALTSFKRIEHKDEYREIVPYYIAEIHYFTGKKDKALSDALRLINKRQKSYYDKELHLLAGQVYFENAEYKEALPFFEHYYDNTDRIRKEDLYEMAYCYYKLNDWANAIEYFQQLSETRDSLGQSSMYLLGDCYLKVDDKKSARNAFSICADMPYNSGQKEASLLLAAKLSYELGFNSDAIYYTNLLFADFPDSKHTDDAKTLMSDLLIRTRNYAEAYSTLQDVSRKGADYSRVYQKVTYGYAMQQLQNGNTRFADSLLNMSLQEAVDPTYKSAASFWKADASYKLGKHAQTLAYGKQFLSDTRGKEWVHFLSPAATDRNMYITLGYAAMELSKYDEAQNYFSKARYNADTADSVFIATTILHEADAVFMQKDYKKATALYDNVIKANVPETDYALYQKAKILGLQGNNRQKAEILSGLINSVPPSKYANEARYELGLTFIEDDKYSSAINTLRPLTEAYEVRNMAPKAWMKIGFAYQQSRAPEKAITSYKHVIEEYPSSEERPAALDALKSLYIQIGKPQRYAKLLKDNNLADNEENVLDSTYYATAEAQYAAGNYEQAVSLLRDYIAKYPNGVFITKANYYKAQAHFNLKEYDEALKSYDFVLNSNWSDFSENSARKAAMLAYRQKNMAAASRYYTQLRNIAMSEESLLSAYEGLMLTNNQMGNDAAASAYADTLLSMPNLNNDIKDNAQLIKANALLSAGNTSEALPLYEELTKTRVAVTAAESRYKIAYINYLNGELKAAEQAANNTIKLSGGNDYWIVKSYILLADILVKQEDYFNAKATLQSIVKNCKIPELKQEAESKLAQVKKQENKESKLSE